MPRGWGFRWMWWFPSIYWPWTGWWFWRCRWFPWLPRWWWTGIYGPVAWTPYGPVIPGYTSPPIPPKTESEYLKEQKRILEEELKEIERRIKELEESK